MPTLQSIHDAQKQYVTDLEKLFPYTKLRLWKLIRLLWPEIEELPTGDASIVTLRIRMSPLMNLLGAIGCGDMNAVHHTGDGYMQTFSLIGVCSAIASYVKPGYALAKIDAPVDFKTAVPIGTPLIMTVREIRSRSSVSIIELHGWIETSNIALFGQPRRITMKRILTDPSLDHPT
jgi:hypothetical protein